MSALDERIVEVECSERRDTFRMPKTESLQSAKLKIGKKLIDVTVLDESAGGFLISANRIPDTKSLQNVELFHTSGAHFLRIAWRRNVDGLARMGLQRLCQAPAKPESPWLVWFVAAVVAGIGVGFVAATSNNPNLLDRVLDSSQVIENSTIDTPQATD